MLQLLSRFLNFAFVLSLARPKLVLTLFIFAIALGSLGMLSLRTPLKIQDILDSNSEQARAIGELSATFGLGNTSTLLVQSQKGALTPAEHCAIQTWIAQLQTTRADLLRVVSTYDLRSSERSDGKLLYPAFLRLRCDGSDLPDEITRSYGKLRNSPALGTFVSPDPRTEDVLVEFDFRNQPRESRFGTFDPGQIQDLRKSWNQELETSYPHLKAHWMGEADFQHAMLEGLGQISLLNLGMIAFLCIAMRALLGTWKSGLLFCLTLVTSVTIIYGAMGTSGAQLDVLTHSLFLMLAVAGLEDFVFIAHALGKRGARWRQEIKALVMPGFFTSLTTAIGFGSLCLSSEPIIQRFGFWAALGTLAEYAAAFWLLPALLQTFPRLRGLSIPSRAWFRIPKLERRMPPRFLLYASLLCLPGGFWAISTLETRDAPLLLFPEGHSLRVSARELLRTRGWEAPIDVVFRNGDQSERNKQVLDSLAREPGVKAVFSPYAFLDHAKAGHPSLTQALIEREFRSSPELEKWRIHSGEARAALYMESSDHLTALRIRDRVQALCPERECWATGSIVAYGEFTKTVPSALFGSFSISDILIFLVIIGLAKARRVGGVLPLVVSALWGPAVILCVMRLLDVEINLMTCMFTSVLVGLVGDNAIQFIYSKKDGLAGGILERGGASIICATLMATACLLFLFSPFAPPRVFGLLLSAGFVASVFGDIWILKLLTENGAAKQEPRSLEPNK